MRQRQQRIREADLQRWRLIERFQAELAQTAGTERASTWSDPRRRLELSEYLGLYLFGLLNPVVKTMRGLCAASGLERVQEDICGRPVSLGSFSEAQAVAEPELLEAVFGRLLAEGEGPKRKRRMCVVDSTVMRVVPRMSWALWRRNRGAEGAVRLHVEFDLARGRVEDFAVTPAKTCERRAWRRLAKAGSCYIGDRYYSYDYGLLAELEREQVDFIVRLRADAQWVEEASAVLAPADRAAGVTWSGVVRLGANGDGPRVRVVQVLGENETILLATTLPAADAPPELIGSFYRHRWEVELFFRWLKCILDCRHWLAESPRGVALQVYLALIAAQLLVLYGGRRPNRRQMERIQFYLMGWASAEEVAQTLRPSSRRKG